MSLDPQAVTTKDSPEWWMVQLSQKMLSTQRLRRFAILDAYRDGRPPMVNVSAGARQVFYEFLRISRTNLAPVIIRAAAERMTVRAIRTAAAADTDGDQIAWDMWTTSGLELAETDVNSDMLTFSEAYVWASVTDDGQPIGQRCAPWQTIVVPDPLNPLEPRAAMHITWDEWAQKTYAYLWLPGQQWVASADQTTAPPRVGVPGSQIPSRWAFEGVRRFSFSASQFTMRPSVDEVDPADRDGGPYCQTYAEQVVPIVQHLNRFGKGEYEDHLDLLDRINHTICTRVVTAAVQAYKQRALQQGVGAAAAADAPDRLPKKDPDTDESINWDEIFQPGPDALWKLPPGVTIWESAEVNLQPVLLAATDDIKVLSAVTSTPFSMFSPDAVNQSAEGVQDSKESLVFKVEDREKISGRSHARTVSLMFRFSPDDVRLDGDDNDRSDFGKIKVDWAPAERYSLGEKATADSLNKSLSPEMAAVKIWGLSEDEAQLNRSQRASEALLVGAQGLQAQQARRQVIDAGAL